MMTLAIVIASWIVLSIVFIAGFIAGRTFRAAAQHHKQYVKGARIIELHPRAKDGRQS